MLTKEILTQQLKELVGYETVTGNLTEIDKALTYIETLLDPKLTITHLNNQESRILLVSTQPAATITPDYGYLVHLDVVPGEKTQFSLEQQGDIVRGRGVADMKFSIPLGVALANQLISENSGPSFCLAITTDEETGGMKGAKFLAEEYQFRPKVLIVPDGGGPTTLINKSKGVCQLTIRSTGEAAHASRPWQGRNALGPLVELAAKLSNQYRENNSKPSWATTMNLGQLHAGEATNQVCPQAELKIDFRFPETETVEGIVQQVKALIQEIDPSLEVELGSTGLPTYTDPNLSVVQRFIGNLSQVMQQSVTVEGECGASDARHFSPFNIPTIMAKPEGGNIHAEGEWLDLDSTMLFYLALCLQLGLIEN